MNMHSQRLQQYFTTPLRLQAVFFVIVTACFMQSTLFAFREWTAGNLVRFGLISLFYAYCLTVLLQYTAPRVGKAVLYVMALIPPVINVFLHLEFNSRLSPNILLLLAETNIKECSDFFSTYAATPSFVITVVLCLLSVAVIVLMERRTASLPHCITEKVLLTTALACAGGGFVATADFYRLLFTCTNATQVDEVLRDHHLKPMDNVSCLVYSIYDLHLMRNEVDEALKMTMNMKGTARYEQDDSLNVVLVIGESYNKRHAGLYGYQLNTTPYMDCEQEQGRLFVFTNTVSPYNLTSKVLRNMFSTNSLGNGESWTQHPFFPAIFQRAGFQVAFWDNQYDPSSREEFDFSLNAFLHHPALEKQVYAKTNSQTFETDDQLIDDFEQHAADRKPRLQLMMFHLMGQHFSYYNRYPHGSDFDHFNADSIDQQNDYLTREKRQLIADYDNATRFNDWCLSKIIENYRQANTVLLYLADHGEEVYDYRDKYSRSWEKPVPREVARYQYETPMIIWFSDSYMRKNPEKVAAVKQSLDRPFSIDNICHMLFSLASLQTTYYRPERDLTNKAYHCPPRLLNDSNDYDE